MKRLILIAVLFSGLTASAQMTTLFEVGAGASQGVVAGFGSFSSMADESGAAFNVAGTWSDTLKVGIINETLGGADFWLTKRIPQMNIYAQLELFTDATLPSNAVFTYAVSTDSVNWNPVPSSNANTPVAFDNSAGNKFLRLNVRVNNFDTTWFSLNYVSVKADSTFFVGMEEQLTETISVSAVNKQLNIQASEEQTYEIFLYNLSGQMIFIAFGKGPQTFEPACGNGIYMIRIAAWQQQTITRLYLN